jgi:hypothetical protein
VTTGAAYARLREVGAPVITTGEAASALRVSTSSASRTLRTLARQGLAGKIRYGLWSLADTPIDPRRLASEITRPYPSYVSFESALSARGMIDQLPREITVASLDRAKIIRTRHGTFAVRHLPPALFGGFDNENGLLLATPEKALFDYYYVTHASTRHRRRLPEVELPDRFLWAKVEHWLRRIEFAPLRARVEESLRAIGQRADAERPEYAARTLKVPLASGRGRPARR